MVHDCSGCPRAKNPEEAAVCLANKTKRMQSISSFHKVAWKLVKERVRPPLAAAIMAGEWEEVASLWAKTRWIVEVAVQGKD